MYKHLFIDLDDTLWDTFNNNKESLKEVYDIYEFNRSYASFEVFFDRWFPYNNHLWDLYRQDKISKQQLVTKRFEHMVEPMGITDPDFIQQLNKEFLQRSSSKSGLLPFALDILRYLQNKYTLHILSNGFREVQYKKMDNSGLTSFFDKIILSEDAGANKPSKDIFDYALSITSANREDVLMIGDSWEADIVGAHQSNIHQVWYNPHRLSPSDFTPTYEIANLKELQNIL
ncbi:MAG TPA: noncanonical pyrimidine nucleotidase, YjjG family [Porphyromonadaceae bacterium]|nr:noncanonical pyrimidine nucleotidase, YjjG family [Porphyromonadaceae bacterium]